jgi:hypothetical protein
MAGRKIVASTHTIIRGALLALLPLAGCATPFQAAGTPVAVEELEGNYRTLAKCTFEQLTRRQYQVRRTDLPDRATVRISAADGTWELSFVNAGGGTLTRTEMKSAGGQASDYALTLARACAA